MCYSALLCVAVCCSVDILTAPGMSYRGLYWQNARQNVDFSESSGARCSVLQCGAVWSSVVQCGAVCCSDCCSVLQYTAVCCSVLQCDAVSCGVLWCVAVCYSVDIEFTFCAVLIHVILCTVCMHIFISMKVFFDRRQSADRAPFIGLFLCPQKRAKNAGLFW